MIAVSVGKKARRIGWTAALAAVAGLSPVALDGQESADEVAERCAMREPKDICYGLAVALQAARAGVGLAAAGGADLPGTSGTLGGFPRIPRFNLVFRVGRTRAPVHSAADRFEEEHETASITAVRAAVGVGVFDGFQLAPDVGGVLSLEVMADFSWVMPPKFPDGNFLVQDSFQNQGFGVGVGVGLVRQTSSRPGVTVSAARRWLGDAHFVFRPSDAFGFGGRSTSFETVVTSVRGMVGKDSSAWGLLGGVGWDRYEGDATLTASLASNSTINPIDADDLRSERLLFFGGLSFDFLMLQFSGEAGWARGFDDEPTGDGRFDPSDGTFWASLGLGVVL